MPDAVQSAIEYLKRKEGFDCKDILGKGTYGSVVQVETKSYGTLAAKIVENRVVNLLEIKEWSKLKHENVLGLTDTIFNVDGCVIFLTEIMKTNLFQRLQDKEFKRDPKASEKCRRYAKHVLTGLVYLHQQGLCHLDLRAENVFIGADERAVVADFSGLCWETEMKRFCPLPRSLRPPEMLGNKKKVQPKPIDLWAFGMLLANLYLGKGFYVCTVKNERAGHLDAVLQYTGLFQCQSYFEKFFKQTYPNSHLSEEQLKQLMELVNSFLQLEPASRLNSDEALESKFFKEPLEELSSENSSTEVEEHIEVDNETKSDVDKKVMAKVTPEKEEKAIEANQELVTIMKSKRLQWKLGIKKLKNLRAKISSPVPKSEKSKTEEKSKKDSSSRAIVVKTQ